MGDEKHIGWRRIRRRLEGKNIEDQVTCTRDGLVRSVEEEEHRG